MERNAVWRRSSSVERMRAPVAEPRRAGGHRRLRDGGSGGLGGCWPAGRRGQSGAGRAPSPRRSASAPRPTRSTPAVIAHFAEATAAAAAAVAGRSHPLAWPIAIARRRQIIDLIGAERPSREAGRRRGCTKSIRPGAILAAGEGADRTSTATSTRQSAARRLDGDINLLDLWGISPLSVPHQLRSPRRRYLPELGTLKPQDKSPSSRSARCRHPVQNLCPWRLEPRGRSGPRLPTVSDSSGVRASRHIRSRLSSTAGRGLESQSLWSDIELSLGLLDDPETTRFNARGKSPLCQK